eukprot:jgi/Bigna1/144450/aug1.87_g19158
MNGYSKNLKYMEKKLGKDGDVIRTAKLIEQITQRNKGILNLSNIDIALDDVATYAVALFLREASMSVIKIDLANRKIGYFGAQMLSRALQSSSHHALRELNLRDNRIGDKGADAVSEFLQGHGGCLTALNVARNELSTKGVCRVIGTHRTFLKKQFEKNINSEIVWDNMRFKILTNVSTITSLERLDLSGNTADNDNSPAEAASSSLQTEIGHALSVIFERNQSLSEVRLSNLGLRTKAFDAMQEGLKKANCLQALDLSYNSPGPVGTKKICCGLEESNTLLTLNLAMCSSHSSISSEGAGYIASFLEKNNSLKHLNLSHCLIEDQDTPSKGAVNIGQTLASNGAMSLISLNLESNRIKAKGLNAIFKGLVLSANTGRQLKVLNISGNEIWKGKTTVHMEKKEKEKVNEGSKWEEMEASSSLIQCLCGSENMKIEALHMRDMHIEEKTIHKILEAIRLQHKKSSLQAIYATLSTQSTSCRRDLIAIEEVLVHQREKKKASSRSLTSQRKKKKKKKVIFRAPSALLASSLHAMSNGRPKHLTNKVKVKRRGSKKDENDVETKKEVNLQRPLQNNGAASQLVVAMACGGNRKEDEEEKDIEKAVLWYSKAVQQGHQNLQLSNLGDLCYNNRQGVIWDLSKVVRYHHNEATIQNYGPIEKIYCPESSDIFLLFLVLCLLFLSAKRLSNLTNSYELATLKGSAFINNFKIINKASMQQLRQKEKKEAIDTKLIAGIWKIKYTNKFRAIYMISPTGIVYPKGKTSWGDNDVHGWGGKAKVIDVSSLVGKKGFFVIGPIDFESQLITHPSNPRDVIYLTRDDVIDLTRDDVIDLTKPCVKPEKKKKKKKEFDVVKSRKNIAIKFYKGIRLLCHGEASKITENIEDLCTLNNSICKSNKTHKYQKNMQNNRQVNLQLMPSSSPNPTTIKPTELPAANRKKHCDDNDSSVNFKAASPQTPLPPCIMKVTSKKKKKKTKNENEHEDQHQKNQHPRQPKSYFEINTEQKQSELKEMPTANKEKKRSKLVQFFYDFHVEGFQYRVFGIKDIQERLRSLFISPSVPFPLTNLVMWSMAVSKLIDAIKLKTERAAQHKQESSLTSVQLRSKIRRTINQISTRKKPKAVALQLAQMLQVFAIGRTLLPNEFVLSAMLFTAKCLVDSSKSRSLYQNFKNIEPVSAVMRELCAVNSKHFVVVYIKLLYASFLLQIDEIHDQIIDICLSRAGTTERREIKANAIPCREEINCEDQRNKNNSKNPKQITNWATECKQRHTEKPGKSAKYPLMWEFIWNFLGKQDDKETDTEKNDDSKSLHHGFTCAAVLEACLKVASSRLKGTNPKRFKRLEVEIGDNLGKMQECAANFPPSDHYVALLRMRLGHI